jgi:GNAT superfamily N-acetyltransferase
MEDDSYSVLVAANVDDRPVGMVTLHQLISTAVGGPVGLMEDLYVVPAWRRRGVGTALLDAVIEIARHDGLKRLRLVADRRNTGALDFYARHGWSETSLVALHRPV